MEKLNYNDHMTPNRQEENTPCVSQDITVVIVPDMHRTTAASSDNGFSDTFEERADETDCDSLTTEISTVVTEINLTSSPSVLVRYLTHVDSISETDSWSDADVPDAGSGGIVSLVRSSPDGQSSTGDVVEAKTLSYDESLQPDTISESPSDKYTGTTTPKADSLPLFLPLSRLVFALGDSNESSVSHVVTPGDSQPVHQPTVCVTSLSKWQTELPSEESFQPSCINVNMHDETIVDADNHSYNTGEVNDQEVLCIQDASKVYSNSDRMEKEVSVCSADSPKHVLTKRSMSLPDFSFSKRYQSQQHSQNLFFNPDQSNIFVTNNSHLTDRNTQRFGKTFFKRHVCITNEQGPSAVNESETSFSTSYITDQIVPQSSRRQDSSSSSSVTDYPGYRRPVSPLREPTVQDMRKHLPNPFNKLNHRFHSTLHCPCFIFFCFLCCYPAVFLMQKSDIQFISGDDDIAKKNGKRASILYIAGGVSSVLLITTLLFLVYYFVGDDLIKASDS